MTDEGSDAFHLEGKNLRQVILEVRKQIRSQLIRDITAAMTFVICITVAFRVACCWEFLQASFLVFITISAVALWGLIMDGLRLRYLKARLAECEHRLKEEEKP